MIKVISEIIDDIDLSSILSEVMSYSDYDWSLMNEEHINGPFWNGKRIMLTPEVTSKLSNSIISGLSNNYRYTAFNKAQRFFPGDTLGPLIDKEHGPDIEYGLIFFLENSSGGIRFINANQEHTSIAGSLIIYTSDEKYEIFVPESGQTMYFMTFFADKL